MPIYFGNACKKIAVILISCFISNLVLAQDKLIDVKIGLLESLSPTAPSSSDRYRLLNEAALFYAIGENEKKLHKCGYKITTSTTYYDTFDALELVNNAKSLEQAGSWIIIGPRRSSHLIAASKELQNTPIISTMANADAIYIPGKPIFSMYPKASFLAKVMADETIKIEYGKSYGTLVDVRCDACVDFAKAFRQSNSKHKEAFYFEVADDAPNLDKLKQLINDYQVDYLVMPNYSVLTSHVIAETQKYHPLLKYVGADGWGEYSFSFLNAYGMDKNAQGMAIRGGYQDQDKNMRHQVYSLDREINGSQTKPPYSVYALVDLVRILSDDLCHSSAQTKEEFVKYIADQPSNHFQKNIPYSVYKLNNGQLEFSHYVEQNQKKK